MLTIAICDDERPQIEYLCGLLKRWGELFNAKINIIAFDFAAFGFAANLALPNQHKAGHESEVSK